MKKIAFFMMMIAITALLPLLPMKAHAFTGGLLNGKKYGITPNATFDTSIAMSTGVLTDNDESGSSSQLLTVANQWVIFEKFSTPKTISKYYIQDFANADKPYSIVFFNDSDVEISRIINSNVSSGGVRTITPVSGVSRMAIQVVKTNFRLYEFDVFESENFSGGFLDGQPMTKTIQNLSQNGGTITEVTDNNTLTGYLLPNYNTLGSTLLAAFTTTPRTVDSFRFLGESGSAAPNARLRLYDGSNVELYNSYISKSDGSLVTITPVTGVHKVAISNEWGNANFTIKEFNVYGPGSTPPAVPSGLSATPGNGTVSLSWSAVPDNDLAGYNVWKDGVKVNGSLIAKPTTSYNVTGLTNGTTYSFQVSAVDVDGYESAKSTAVTSVPIAPPDTTPPATPTNVTVNAGDGAALVSWSPVADSDLAGYHVYLNSVRQTTTPITATSFTVTALTNGTTYSFQVSAVDTSGNESPKSAPVQATPNAVVVPPKPEVKASVSNEKVVLTWKAIPAVIKYIIYRDGAPIGEASQTTFTDTNVTNGIRYSYEVAAVNDNGEGPKGQVYAKPAKVPEMGGLDRLPFNVGDMIKTAINFLRLFPDWILITLGCLFAPALIYIAMRLTTNKNMQDQKQQYKVGRNGKVEKAEKSGKAGKDKTERVGRAEKPSKRYAGMTKSEWEKFSKEEIKRTNDYLARKKISYKLDERERQHREKRDVVYRSTGERDRYGNRIRVTQEEYEKRMRGRRK